MGDQLAIWVVLCTVVALAVAMLVCQDRRITALERWRLRQSRDQRSRPEPGEWWKHGGEFPGTFD